MLPFFSSPSSPNAKSLQWVELQKHMGEVEWKQFREKLHKGEGILP